MISDIVGMQSKCIYIYIYIIIYSTSELHRDESDMNIIYIYIHRYICTRPSTHHTYCIYIYIDLNTLLEVAGGYIYI